jgi:predicted O-methyltransferase YrrM
MSEELKLNASIVDYLEKRETDINVHLRTLFNLVVQNGYKVVVELGAGQSTYVLAAAVRETGGQFWSVDLDPSAHQRGFAEGRGVLQEEPRYIFLAGNDMEIVRTWEKEIDFLFIDTSNQFDHTLAELREWTKFVRVGGRIAMHDTYHKIGHAVDCRKALEAFLGENPGRFSVVHNEDRGGLSVLTRLE